MHWFHKTFDVCFGPGDLREFDLYRRCSNSLWHFKSCYGALSYSCTRAWGQASLFILSLSSIILLCEWLVVFALLCCMSTNNRQTASESTFNLFTAQCASRWWQQVNGLCLNEITVCLPGLEIYASFICQPYLSGYKKKLLSGPFAETDRCYDLSLLLFLWAISSFSPSNFGNYMQQPLGLTCVV